MDHSENDLLISAYLDGELTADERAQVDQLLATSPGAQQLIDELRALRAGLQELPQHTLEPQFAQQVLQRVQQELTAKTNDPTPHSPLRTPNSLTPPLSPSPSFRLPRPGRRGIMWSLLAVAAAVLIVVTNRPDPGRQVAQQNQPNRAADLRAKNETEHLAVGHELPQMSATPQAAPAVQSAPPTAPLALDNFGGNKNRETELFDRTKSTRGNQLDTMAPPAAGVPADSAPVASAPADGAPLVAGNRSRPGEPAPAGRLAASDSPASSAAAAARMRSETLPLGKANDAKAAETEESLFRKLSLGESDLLVVQIDISPEAARSGKFDGLLAKNHIAFVQPNARPLDEAQTRFIRDAQSAQRSDSVAAKQSAEKSAEKSIEESTEKRADVVDGQQSINRQHALEAPVPLSTTSQIAQDKKELAKQFDFTLPASADQKLDVVYVDATPQQIEGTLEDLRRNPQAFFAVAVAPSSETIERALAISELEGKTAETNAAEPKTRAQRGAGRGGAGRGGSGGARAAPPQSIAGDAGGRGMGAGGFGGGGGRSGGFGAGGGGGGAGGLGAGGGARGGAGGRAGPAESSGGAATPPIAPSSAAPSAAPANQLDFKDLADKDLTGKDQDKDKDKESVNRPDQQKHLVETERENRRGTLGMVQSDALDSPQGISTASQKQPSPDSNLGRARRLLLPATGVESKTKADASDAARQPAVEPGTKGLESGFAADSLSSSSAAGKPNPSVTADVSATATTNLKDQILNHRRALFVLRIVDAPRNSNSAATIPTPTETAPTPAPTLPH